MRVSAWLYLLEQTLCSWCLLSCVGLCAGMKQLRRGRCLLLSLMLSAAALLGHRAAAWLRLPLLVLASAAAPLLIWPDAPRSLRLRMVLPGLLTPLLFTGTLRTLAAFSLPGAAALLAGCLLLRAAPGMLRRTGDTPPSTTVSLRLGQRHVSLTALIDTGNLLRDAVTGLPVIVVSRRAGARLMHLPADGSILPGMRLMSVRTVSGSSLMTIVKPDSVRILVCGSWREAPALIGLSPDGYEGFQALVPACLVRQEEPIPRKIHLSGRMIP